ncbi:TPA: GMP synthase [Legionella pneumophila]|nr:glutamine amidotransferase [Legionella pneumophila]HAT2046983.1 GMP synthase [Legionella pneumophila]HAT4006154.1 GMP synthase [Legionella pneumophila]HAT6361548.1 GMP synthase [Legionella pneumophila]HAT6365146.1 GMP synthase [Legionella pneumophila]HAT6368171.1 GMP synthase [Legionella pneumophila]
MNLGILLCDKVSEVFVEDHGQYPEMFANLLRPADATLEFTIFDAEHGELPTDVHAVDAYLISGSRHGVNDDYPWIRKLEEFVRTLHASQKKLIGICFGHQLIAKALGGKVIKSPKGWGVGMSQNQIYQFKEWMKPSLNCFNLLVSHQDQVIELPTDAEILAGSDFCPNYMMQIGSFFSVQGHPEFTKSYSRDLMVSREDSVNEIEFAKGMKSLELHEDDTIIAQWIINFLKA